MASLKPFDSKVILINGAAQGIGASTARYLTERGAILSLCDVNSRQLGDLVASYLRDFPGAKIHHDTVDIRHPDEVERWVSATKEKFGRIDGCFNNAGIAHPPVPLTDMSSEMFAQVIDTNLTGTFNCLRVQLKYISEGGSIVNNASCVGIYAGPGPGVAAYVASKHGIVGLTRQAAVECASRGVRVNAICPAFAEGRMFDDFNAALGGNFTPVDLPQLFRRLLKPEEIAGLVAYLLGHESRFITKAIISIDGGMPGL